MENFSVWLGWPAKYKHMLSDLCMSMGSRCAPICPTFLLLFLKSLQKGHQKKVFGLLQEFELPHMVFLFLVHDIGETNFVTLMQYGTHLYSRCQEGRFPTPQPLGRVCQYLVHIYRACPMVGEGYLHFTRAHGILTLRTARYDTRGKPEPIVPISLPPLWQYKLTTHYKASAWLTPHLMSLLSVRNPMNLSFAEDLLDSAYSAFLQRIAFQRWRKFHSVSLQITRRRKRNTRCLLRKHAKLNSSTIEVVLTYLHSV